MKNCMRALTARIEASVSDVGAILKRSEILAEKYRSTGDDGFLDGLALILHWYYSPIERIFEGIARTIDADLPSGPDWHRDLLTQRSAAIPDTRPPVIARETRLMLDEFRGFRHVVRNIYSFHLNPRRVPSVARQAVNCNAAVERGLLHFNDFLTSLSTSDHS